MQANQLKPGDRVKYVAKLGESANSDTFAYAIVDRIDTCDNGLVWLLIGEKGYERSHPFHPSRIIEVTPVLTQEQLAALISFAKDNGRNWKTELRHSWMTCNYTGRDDGHLLQQIRNRFGPTWLVNFRLPKSKEASCSRAAKEITPNMIVAACRPDLYKKYILGAQEAR
jgi:hypothetical protein